jgi:hypothetical protein
MEEGVFGGSDALLVESRLGSQISKLQAGFELDLNSAQLVLFGLSAGGRY